MDAAYDHIQEDLLRASTSGTTTPTASSSTTTSAQQPADLNTELADTFRAFSNSPWGAKLGGFWGNVRKQGESVYEGARQEYNVASGEAIKGFTGLKETIISQAQRITLEDAPEDEVTAAGAEQKVKSQDEQIAENDGLISRFKSEAAKRLKEIEKAEDAADEALLRFGTNIRNFLRDAVTIAAPEENADKSQVLFESKDSEGKRVIHTTRFEAQLHVIHSSLDSFLKDPVSPEWESWKSGFNVEAKTEEIATDLEKYPELRRAMEKAVPEKVEYADFWCRYYFLRLVIETEEQKRRELLKGMSHITHPHFSILTLRYEQAQPRPKTKLPGTKTRTQTLTTMKVPPPQLLKSNNQTLALPPQLFKRPSQPQPPTSLRSNPRKDANRMICCLKRIVIQVMTS